MRTRRTTAIVAAIVLAAAGAAGATSIFVEGVITKVQPDFRNYTVKGYDHYNHTRYSDKITEIPVKVAANGTFVLDNRLVRGEIALAAGRCAYAIGSSAGGSINLVLSEPAARTVGVVGGADGAKLKLKAVQGLDAVETDIALAGDAAFLDEAGKPVAKDAVLAAGKMVRVAAARKQTVQAFSEKAFADMIPKGVPTAVCGVIKKLPAPGGVPTLAVAKGDAVEELAPDVKKAAIGVDAWGDTCHGAILKPRFAIGQPAVFITFEKRPGVPNSYLFVTAADAGRVEGTVKSYDAARKQLVVKTLTPDGFKDETVTLDAAAGVKLDGADAAPPDALKSGTRVSVYNARPQTIQTVTPASEAKH